MLEINNQTQHSINKLNALKFYESYWHTACNEDFEHVIAN